MLSVVAVVLALFCVTPAKADSIGSLTLSGCGGGVSGCPDATYSFNITSTTATLAIHIDGAVTAGQNDHIIAVNLGFTPANNVSGLTLFSAPAGWNFGTDTIATSQISSVTGLCNAGGTSAFVCASFSPGITIAQNGTYEWVWNYTLTNPNKIAGDVHIGANYDPQEGWIVSQPISVPEPTSLTLFTLGLAGLFGLAFVSRRQVFNS
jgi:hypothetical protein